MASPGTRSRRWLLLLGSTALLVGLAMALPSARSGANGLFAELVVDVFGDTEFAPGYDEKAFAALPLLADETVVRATLGAPLMMLAAKPGTLWLYANGDAPDFATTGEVAGPSSYTVLEFDAGGTFVGAHGQLGRGGPGSSQIDLDPAARLGRNHLGLDGTAVDRLRERGATFADLEGLFGKPRAVRTSTAVREWFYSRSPSSSHHHIRSLGLDSAGRLCWKRRGVYWD